MGQVPTHRYVLIGSGAMARHLYFYLSSLNPISTEILQWNRKDHSIDELHSLLASATHVLLAISDSAIEEFFQTYRDLATDKAKWVHFSGANNFTGIVAAHPLMSFGPELYDLNTYKKIHLTLTGAQSLKEIFPTFENSFSILSPEKKSLYHSLCVLGGNMPILLWEKMNHGLQQMGFPAEATDVYLQTILENYLDHKEKALTGPLKRKDLITIKKNLSALQDDSFQKIYSAFAESQNINTRDL